jgi:hypothetical protein
LEFTLLVGHSERESATLFALTTGQGFRVHKH